MDAEVEKQGDYATTRQCEGGGWGVFEARRLCDNAKGMDVEFQKQCDFVTTMFNRFYIYLYKYFYSININYL
jgi:hypothetical protein